MHDALPDPRATLRGGPASARGKTIVEIPKPYPARFRTEHELVMVQILAADDKATDRNIFV